jgi:hypothetical protein
MESQNNSTPTTPTKTSYTIRQAAAKLQVSEMYLRKQINVGKLPTTKVQITENVWRHEISQADLDAFKNRTSNRSSRNDGRNKFVVYLSHTEEAQLRAQLKSIKMTDVEKLLTRANPGNAKKE